MFTNFQFKVLQKAQLRPEPRRADGEGAAGTERHTRAGEGIRRRETIDPRT